MRCPQRSSSAGGSNQFVSDQSLSATTAAPVAQADTRFDSGVHRGEVFAAAETTEQNMF
jgi:hypothetical protein